MTTSRKSCMVVLVMMAVWISAACGILTVFAAESPEDRYAQARKAYLAALSVADKGRKIDELRGCIRQLRALTAADAGGKVSDKCTYLAAQGYHAIYDLNQSHEDLRCAVDGYRTVVHQYPKSPLADDAQYLIGVAYSSEDPSQAYVELAKVRLFFPKGDMVSRATRLSAQLANQIGCDRNKRKQQTVSSPVKDGKTADDQKVQKEAKERTGANEPDESQDGKGNKGRKGSEGLKQREGKKAAIAMKTTQAFSQPSSPACPTLVRLEKMQHWAAADYTRVVLYTSGPLNYTEHAIPPDPKNRQPGKIYVELMDCAINPKMKSHVRIKDRFLQEVRAEQCESTLARVVLDTGAIDSYRIFPLTDPARLIIDVRGSGAEARTGSKAATTTTTRIDPAAIKGTLPTLTQQLALDIKRIVIDPGHGGKDKGAIGPNNVYEKDIVLSIAKRLKRTLEAKTVCEVILTRTKDRFVSLEERTAIANSQKADLFISIHTNAHKDRRYHGMETYSLNLSNDQESARVAALENATSTRKVSDLEAILHDLLLNTKLSESSRLAGVVQRHTVSTIKANYRNVRDLGTKQAPFYVLLGAEMPSILIETAFITNAEEVNRLKDAAFQDKLAKGITAGVEAYIQQIRGLARKGGDQS